MDSNKNASARLSPLTRSTLPQPLLVDSSDRASALDDDVDEVAWRDWVVDDQVTRRLWMQDRHYPPERIDRPSPPLP